MLSFIKLEKLKITLNYKPVKYYHFYSMPKAEISSKNGTKIPQTSNGVDSTQAATEATISLAQRWEDFQNQATKNCPSCKKTSLFHFKTVQSKSRYKCEYREAICKYCHKEVIERRHVTTELELRPVGGGFKQKTTYGPWEVV